MSFSREQLQDVAEFVERMRAGGAARVTCGAIDVEFGVPPPDVDAAGAPRTLADMDPAAQERLLFASSD